MKVKATDFWKLYQDENTLFSLQVRLKIKEILSVLKPLCQDQEVTNKLVKRLLRDAFANETPLLLLDEIAEILIEAVRVGVSQKVVLSASYEQVVKTTLRERHKEPRFKREKLYGED